MRGSVMEGGYVFAFTSPPDSYSIKNSDVHNGVLISFKTRAAFEEDKGIKDPKILKYGPVRSVFKGSIIVWDVKVVK